MANPTTNFGWALPLEGQDSWHTTVQSVFNAIDTSVHSIEVTLIPHVTLVLSVYLTGSISISSANQVLMGADGGWTIGSAAPYGRFVGSFSLATSGALGWFDLGLSANVTGASFASTLITRARLVLNKTATNTMVVPSNSAWINLSQVSGLGSPFPSFTDVKSLGPGAYSVELQFNAPGPSATSSILSINPNNFITLTVAETRP